VLLGNTFVNIGATTVATLVALHFATIYSENQATWVGGQVVVTTVILLFFGEVTPKLLAYSKPEAVAGFAGFFVEILEYVLYPVVFIFEKISQLTSRKDNIPNAYDQGFTSEDFRNLISSKTANHPLEENEKRIIASIFRLSTTEVREIIVPRVDIIAVDENASMSELREILQESGYSRIPVYHENIDDIVGVVYDKDLILHPLKQSIRELMRPAYFVTENMKVQILLNQFKSKKLQIAIVVDEYGGTSGLVTLEDILEELVGEIMDEYDEDEPPMLNKLNDREYIVNGMYGIGELNHEFGLNIDSSLYDNLADFLLAEFNRIPKRGESIEFEDRVSFMITNIKGQRIRYVKMRLLEFPDENSI
jgi:CBS domain containing-hemolysin-like protein